MTAKILKIAAAVGIVGILAACATTEGYQQQMNLKVGYTTDRLKIEWGVPENISPLADGSELWVYSRTQVYHSGNSYMQVPIGSYTEQYTDKNGKTKTRTRTTYTSQYVPPSTSETHCETRFVVGADQTVKSVAFEGDGCVAEEISSSR